MKTYADPAHSARLLRNLLSLQQLVARHALGHVLRSKRLGPASKACLLFWPRARNAAPRRLAHTPP